MSEQQNLRQNFVLKYDPLYARFSREIKTTDIPNIGYKGVSTVTAENWDMFTYTVDDDHALFPYIFTVHSSNTAAQFVVLIDTTTTALSLQVDSLRSESLVTDCECPLMRVAPGEEVKITVPGHVIDNFTDTYAAFLIAARQPIPSVVEN